MSRTKKERARGKVEDMDGIGPTHTLSGAAPVAFNPDRYRQHVDHLDLPEAAKSELLAAVWQIMSSFVDRAFGDDPVQLILSAEEGAAGKDAQAGASMLDSDLNQKPSDKTRLASAFAPPAARRGKERP